MPIIDGLADKKYIFELKIILNKAEFRSTSYRQS